MNIAFAGLGVMGYPIATRLAAAGHTLTVFNRTRTKADLWAAECGGQVAATVTAAARGSDLLILCVGADQDVREIVNQAAPAMSGGAMIVDHTTTSADLARAMAILAAAHDVAFLDAPVSGGEAGAKNGTLTVMAGGEEGAFERATPVFRAYAKAAQLMGPSGSGQLTKMVNQICIAGLVQALAEAAAFARRAGLDPEKVHAAIGKGAAQSWQMDNRWASMSEGRFDFGFAVDLMRKDLGLVLAEARANGARLEVTALVDQFYAEVQAMGGGRWDTSSLMARLSQAPSKCAAKGAK